MNSRIYLQPDAVPTQDDIRTANRLFRHFGKEVTFLQGLEKPDAADITMNRLRWALENPVNFDRAVFRQALQKSSNIVLDFARLEGDEATVKADFQALFEAEAEAANLVIVLQSEEVLLLEKTSENSGKKK